MYEGRLPLGFAAHAYACQGEGERVHGRRKEGMLLHVACEVYVTDWVGGLEQHVTCAVYQNLALRGPL